MSPQLVRIGAGVRRAIRTDDGRLLAVPPLPATLPSVDRVRVYEAVLRGDLGLAATLAEVAADVAAGRDAATNRLAATVADVIESIARKAAA